MSDTDSAFTADCKRLSEFPTAFTTDVLKVAQTGQWLATPWVFGVNGTSVAGQVAALVEVEPDWAQPDDFANLYESSEVGLSDKVLVIRARGTSYWTLGENTVNFAAECGAVACLIDGAVRDADALEKAAVPTFARQLTPRPPSHKRAFRYEDSASLSESVVATNSDVVHLDGDGACIFPRSMLRQLVEAVKVVASSEMEQADVIKHGGSASKVREVIAAKNDGVQQTLENVHGRD